MKALANPTCDTPPRDTHEWRRVAAIRSDRQTSILRVSVFVCVLFKILW